MINKTNLSDDQWMPKRRGKKKGWMPEGLSDDRFMPKRLTKETTVREYASPEPGGYERAMAKPYPMKKKKKLTK